MSTLKQIKAPIEEELKYFEPVFKASMKSHVPLLNVITNYILRRKGKQMRPMFVFLSAKLTGQVNQTSYTAATLIELLHTASLIHDDVVDAAYQRRGFFSINALWKSKIAVLIGDFFLSKGLLIAIENNAFDLLKIVSDAVKAMSEGELLQIEKSRRMNISEDDYYTIIKQKTAALIAACTTAGCSSTGASPEEIEKMKLFGELTGMAFQIKDDLLDYQGKTIGKATGNDIKEKKLTLPLIHVLSKVSQTEKKQLLRKIRKEHNKPEKVKEIIDYVEKNGGIAYAKDCMLKFQNEAIDTLNYFPDSVIKNSLIQLVKYTTDRKK